MVKCATNRLRWCILIGTVIIIYAAMFGNIEVLSNIFDDLLKITRQKTKD